MAAGAAPHGVIVVGNALFILNSNSVGGTPAGPYRGSGLPVGIAEFNQKFDLELWSYAKAGEGRWKLEYSLRESPEEGS